MILPHWRNVLFDLDGTLIDSRPGIIAGMRHALATLGHALPAEEEQSLDWVIGPPLAQVLARLLQPFGDDHRTEQAVTAYREWYWRVGLFDARVYPGVPGLLEELARERALFVCTAKRTAFARRVLEHFDLARCFQGIHGGEPDGRFDDKSELIRYLISAYGMSPEQTVLVGDREHDVLAGRGSGVSVIAVTYGYGGREELLAAGASVLCDSPGDVLEALNHGRS
jgi:phosphoglycolate phosphatase